ncbi:MAG: hypothetical protein OXI96_08050 [Acidimicrobiaceae bacterium]|nr:hypothetical protein [Acidimicrobiaceae bacterium]
MNDSAMPVGVMDISVVLADEGISALEVTLRTPVAFRTVDGRSRTIVSRRFTRSPPGESILMMWTVI